MLVLRPLLVLLVPLIVTVMRGRTAWVWLSLGVAILVLEALLFLCAIAGGRHQLSRAHSELSLWRSRKSRHAL